MARRLFRCIRLVGAGVALVAVFAQTAAAQRTVKTVGTDIRNAVGDVLGVWSSPFRADSRDWLTAAAVIGAGVAISPLDDDADRWLLDHPNSVIAQAGEPFRENYEGFKWVDLPTGRRIWRINGTLYALGFILDKPGLRDAGLGCMAAQQASGIVRSFVVYELIARDRPSELVDTVGGMVVQIPAQHGDQYELGVPGGPWEQHSFFGGHVANAWACASFVENRYSLGVAEAIPYLFATGMTIARSVDRRHWASDDLIGAAFGYAIGRVVAQRQLKRRDARERENRGEASASPAGGPVIGNHASGSYIGWEFRFR
jgi:membrane-associated phospholipid phosphatase